MHVLICGAGRVGQGIARRLAREKHEITIIDENADLVDQVSIDLDVRGIVGHAAHPDVLKRARAAVIRAQARMQGMSGVSIPVPGQDDEWDDGPELAAADRRARDRSLSPLRE